MSFGTQKGDAVQRLHAALVKNCRNYTLVLSILLVVSYVGVLRPPHPVGAATRNAVEGSVPPHLSWPQALFLCVNSFTFLSAMAGLLLTTSTVLSPSALPSFSSAASCREEDGATRMKRVAAMVPKAVLAGIVLAASTTSCAVAFFLAGLSTVRKGAGLSEKLPVIVPCAMGFFVFLQAVLIFGRDVGRFWMQVRAAEEELCGHMKEETVAGKLLTMWGELLQPRKPRTATPLPAHQERAPHSPALDDDEPSHSIQVVISE